MSDEKKSHYAGLGINIPHSMIEDTIRAEMVSAMPNPEIWVAQIVKRALEEPAKDRGGYTIRGKTIFQHACEEMILEEAKAVFAEWLKQHRDEIRKSLVSEMTKSKGKRIKKLAENLADGACDLYVSSIRLGISEPE